MNPHPEVTAAFERFLQVLRGIQVLHGHAPHAEGKVYPYNEQTFWLVMVNAPPKAGTGVTMTYCFIVRTQPEGFKLPVPHRGLWPTGTILTVSGGRPNLKNGIGSIFGKWDYDWARKEIDPDLVLPFIPSPTADYFMDDLGLGPHSLNNAKARANNIRAAKRAEDALKPLSASDLPDSFGTVQTPSGYIDPHSPPGSPPGWANPPPRRPTYHASPPVSPPASPQVSPPARDLLDDLLGGSPTGGPPAQPWKPQPRPPRRGDLPGEKTQAQMDNECGWNHFATRAALTKNPIDPNDIDLSGIDACAVPGSDPQTSPPDDIDWLDDL